MRLSISGLHARVSRKYSVQQVLGDDELGMAGWFGSGIGYVEGRRFIKRVRRPQAAG